MSSSIREVGRSPLSVALVAALAVVLTAGGAYAGTIAGTALPTVDTGFTYSGVGFIANVNATLTGFTFTNQGWLTPWSL